MTKDLNKPIIKVVAGLVHFKNDNSNQVAVFRRSGPGPGAGDWEFPGGKLEPGESEHQALQRELQEELGITSSVEEFIAESRTELEKKIILLRLYSVKADHFNFQLVDHDAYEWVSINELEKVKLSQPDQPFVAILKNKYIPNE
ncbi:MAG TPA: NUDIX domain-containing protein [Pseudobdellovibrionaceae bacterium]|nr:NUDIX domain-containing protein [Pseudobdellovibrionaceae bacterium]